MLIVSTFSRTIFFFVWILFIILGFYVGEKSNFVNIFCLLTVTYILGTSILICLLCSTQSSKKFVEELVGLSFMQKHAFNKGLYNLFILMISFFVLLFLDMCFIEYLVSSQLEEYNIQFSIAEKFFENGNIEMGQKTRDGYLQLLEQIPNTKGYVGQLATHLNFVQNYISKMFGF